MTRLIDADKLIFYKPEEKTPDGPYLELDNIERAETVDAVEVVRCKDCRWYENDGWGYGNCYRRNVDYLRMSDNGFCSFGERREDVQEPD